MTFSSVYDMTNNLPSVTFQDNLSSDNWTDAGSNGVENGHLQLDSYLDGTDNTTYRAITELSDTEFVMKFSFKPNYTGYTTGTWSHLVYFGLASGTGNSASTQDWVTIGIEAWSSGNRKIGGFAINNNTMISDMPSTPANNSIMTFASATTYYCKIIRNGDNFTFNIYSDSAYSTQVGTVTRTVSGITGLDTLVGTNWIISKSGSSGNDGTLTCEIDDVEIYNGVTNENVKRQHFWDWFSGDSLNARWTFYMAQGTGTGAMQDTVDGGFKMHATSSIAQPVIAFGDGSGVINPFSPTGSVVIMTVKPENAAVGGIWAPLAGFATHADILGTGRDYANLNNSTDGTYIATNTRNVSSYTGASTTFPSTTNDSMVWKVECTPSSVVYNINGTLQSTVTTSLPANPMHPNIGVRDDGAGALPVVSVRYVEAWNT